MTWPVYSSLLLLLLSKHSLQLEGKSLCAGKNVTSVPVIDYCNAQGGYLIDRCCRASDNGTFIAVDLMGMDLMTVPNFTNYQNFNLSVIDLRDNPQLEPSTDDFLMLNNLDDLVLPNQFDCPGQQRVWEFIENITEPSGRRCRHQKDFCANATDVCVERDSLCATNGPNHFLCQCKPEYHGYKCLRKGKFPSDVFYGTALPATVLLSIVLCWTQRRHVKT